MDVMFRWSPFGIIGNNHGDYFIRQGKATREKEILRYVDGEVVQEIQLIYSSIYCLHGVSSKLIIRSDNERCTRTETYV